MYLCSGMNLLIDMDVLINMNDIFDEISIMCYYSNWIRVRVCLKDDIILLYCCGSTGCLEN